MRVGTSELAQLAKVIDGVYEGKPPPRVGGRFGQYLRRCANGRFEVQQLLAREGLITAKSGWVDGAEVGPLTLEPLASIEGSVPNDLWGPVEHLPTVAEALGAVVDLTLWTDATAANRAHVLLSRSLTPISLSGSYRWFAPSRLTPGEARVDSTASVPGWSMSRFLKATADDISRAPHALEYILDYRLGDPGFKVFRTFGVRAKASTLWVLPGIDAPARPIAIAAPQDPRLAALGEGECALVFAYVEPWNGEWVVVDVQPADIAGCLAHLVTWADFQAELAEKPELGTSDLAALRGAIVRTGFDPPEAYELMAAVPPRALSRPGRALTRWLRYRI